jgi:hypothetical protein
LARWAATKIPDYVMFPTMNDAANGVQLFEERLKL